MKLFLHLDEQEPFSNIGIAKALIENPELTTIDLQEIADHLCVYVSAVNNERKERGYER